MKFTTIKDSPIKSPSAAFLYGKLAADPNALDKIDSSVIVSTLFGITQTDPSAIEITEAMVRTLETVESNEIRTMLQDRGTHGVIWRFTTPKMFLLQLSKIPGLNGHHDLSLSLVTCKSDDNDGYNGPTIFTRELVRFNSKQVTFFEKDIPRSIDYSLRMYNKLVDLHDEAVAKLEKKALESAPIQKIQLKESTVVTFEVEGSKLLLKNALTGTLIVSFEGQSYVDQITSRGNTVILHNVDLLVGKDCSMDIIGKIKGAITIDAPTTTHVDIPKEPKPEEASTTTTQENESVETQEILPPNPPEEKEEKPIELAFHKGDTVKIEQGNEPDTMIISKLNEDGTVSDDDSHELTDPNIKDNFDGNYYWGIFKAKHDIPCVFLDEYKQFSDLMDCFELIEGRTTITIERENLPPLDQLKHPNGVNLTVGVDMGNTDGTFVTSTTVVDAPAHSNTEQEGTQEKENKEMSETKPTETLPPLTAADYHIEFASKNLEIVKDSLINMLVIILNDNRGITPLNATEMLREASEIDEVKVIFEFEGQGSNGKWIITEEAAVPSAINREEVKTIDIHNQNNQLAMLRGLFGVSDPAITHIEKFLKKHLTDEGNPGFMATGTFPTETTIIYTEKPYDITYCIVKYLNGTYYRIFAAVTNPALEDHGYVATKDIPGRWVKLGRDIQDTNMRRFNRMPSNNYRR